MNIYADNRMLSLGLVGGTVSRHAGNMRTADAQAAVYQQLNIPAKQILHFHQTHSDRIIRIASDADALAFQNQPEQEADAWLFSCGKAGRTVPFFRAVSECREASWRSPSRGTGKPFFRVPAACRSRANCSETPHGIVLPACPGRKRKPRERMSARRKSLSRKRGKGAAKA